MQMDTMRVVNLRPESTGAPPGGSERASSERIRGQDMRGEFFWMGVTVITGAGATAPCRGSRVAGERAGAYR